MLLHSASCREVAIFNTEKRVASHHYPISENSKDRFEQSTEQTDCDTSIKGPKATWKSETSDQELNFRSFHSKYRWGT